MNNTTDNTPYAPGMRLIIRDEEWLLRNIIRTKQGHWRLDVVGLSPLVRDMSWSFIEEIESDKGKRKKGIEVIDPRETVPVFDDSSYYRKSRLHLEALIRATAPSDAKIHIGHKAAMDVLPYQLQPAALALKQPRQRILIADAVGLGKTIECGILLSELIKRGRARRILVVTVKSILEQFQSELWSRFSIPLVRLDSVAIRRIRRDIPSNQNPFNYYDKSIVSIDTIKQGDYSRFLENARWDVIVIDEAHNVAKRGSGKLSERALLAYELAASRSDSLIMLTATPHDGKGESFASLMDLLDPTAIADPTNYKRDDFKGLYIRRFKKDIAGQIERTFPERKSSNKLAEPSAAEREVFSRLATLDLDSDRSGRNGASMLVKTLLGKTFSSSPAACSSVLETRLKNLGKKCPDSPDIQPLRRLKEAVDAVAPADFSKYQLLVGLLREGGELGWTRAKDDRLVIFTESIPTLDFLAKNLPGSVGLKSEEIATMTGKMSDEEQMKIVKAFGDSAAKTRLLICSDVASEGINLHHMAHRMIHFDIPWSLLTFQQRNGRIDRYGQTRTPEITYLFTNNAGCGVRGDARIWEILIEKDRQVQKNIGDPRELEFLEDIETAKDEEVKLARIIEREDAPEVLEKQLSVKKEEGLDFISHSPGGEDSEEEDLDVEDCSLFQNDYEYGKALCEFAKEREEERGARRAFKFEAQDEEKTLRIPVPEDFFDTFLKRRFPGMFKRADLGNAKADWFLSADKEIVMAAIARGDSTTQLLWERHPMVEWLASKVSADFARKTAPVIFVRPAGQSSEPKLSAGQSIVLGLATIPNRNGVPVVQLWQGALFNGNVFERLVSLEECLRLCGMSSGKTVPNRGISSFAPGEEERLREIIRDAVGHIDAEAVRRKRDYEGEVRPKLKAQLERLEKFKDARTEQLISQYGDDVRRKKEKETKLGDVEKRYKDACRFVEDAMSAEDRASVIITTIWAVKE